MDAPEPYDIGITDHQLNTPQEYYGDRNGGQGYYVGPDQEQGYYGAPEAGHDYSAEVGPGHGYYEVPDAAQEYYGGPDKGQEHYANFPQIGARYDDGGLQTNYRTANYSSQWRRNPPQGVPLGPVNEQQPTVNAGNVGEEASPEAEPVVYVLDTLPAEQQAAPGQSTGLTGLCPPKMAETKTSQKQHQQRSANGYRYYPRTNPRATMAFKSRNTEHTPKHFTMDTEAFLRHESWELEVLENQRLRMMLKSLGKAVHDYASHVFNKAKGGEATDENMRYVREGCVVYQPSVVSNSVEGGSAVIYATPAKVPPSLGVYPQEMIMVTSAPEGSQQPSSVEVMANVGGATQQIHHVSSVIPQPVAERVVAEGAALSYPVVSVTPPPNAAVTTVAPSPCAAVTAVAPSPCAAVTAVAPSSCAAVTAVASSPCAAVTEVHPCVGAVVTAADSSFLTSPRVISLTTHPRQGDSLCEVTHAGSYEEQDDCGLEQLFYQRKQLLVTYPSSCLRFGGRSLVSNELFMLCLLVFGSGKSAVWNDVCVSRWRTEEQNLTFEVLAVRLNMTRIFDK